jgi:hypothetical protein
MMGEGTIFTVHADGSLSRMKPGAPANEDRMQELVAQYPELIGDSDGEPLLIRREHPVSDGVDSRWSLDHLFVTRNAVPVLVELRRAADTRLRREVVGQLLDYAANSVAYWQPRSIAAAFQATCEAAGKDAKAELSRFLGEADPNEFWEQVDANFSAGRVKLVFVADQIPRELARIVEFLNEQMRADVRAVELKWYDSGTGATTLVPRLIGETARAISQKAASKPSALAPISIDGWIEANLRPRGEEFVQGARVFIGIMKELRGEVIVSQSQTSLIGTYKAESGRTVYPFHLWNTGEVSISFRWLYKLPGLTAPESRKEIFDMFANAVGGMTGSNIQGFPSFSVRLLIQPSIRNAIMEPSRVLVQRATAYTKSR